MDSENMLVLDGVKAGVHTVTLAVTGFFTYLITAAVLGTPRLRKNPRFLLLCQQCACLSGFNLLGSVLHSLRYFCWTTTRLTYWILFDLQVVMAHCMTVTLAMMSVCTCLSVCQPLRYRMIIQRSFPWMMLLIWLLALIIPVVFTVLACIWEPWDYEIGLNVEGSTALESNAYITSSLLLLVLSVLLIFSSYFLIYLEGRRAGHFSWSNRKGHRTILIHVLQISFYMVPSAIIISRLYQTLAEAVATFLVFNVGQSLIPIVYGLCCPELRAELPRFLPQCLRRCLGDDSVTNLDRAYSSSISSPGRASTVLSLRVVTGTNSTIPEPEIPLKSTLNMCPSPTHTHNL